VPPTLTVLMTTYHGTSPVELRRSFECILGQTRPPDEFLVVVDGPVSRELDAVLAEYTARDSSIRVERLPENVGSGLASAHGLRMATGDYVARHDSDDISVPHRLETQMTAIASRGLDVVGSAMTEFDGTPDHVVGVRRNPRTHAEIAARMRLNNPINNPTSVFRRELAMQVGGYADLRYMQDYDLFARMLEAGARTENLDEPLVLFNAGGGMIGRRGGWRMIRWEWALQRRLMAAGTIGPVLFVRNMVVRSAFRLIPGPLLAKVYALLFRARRRPEVPA
jgi:glycosyltransferase involved in cell wall biosynthesis